MRPYQRRPEVLIFEAEAKSALPVAESFARQGFRVVAASSRRYCAAFYSRSVRERVVMPNEMTHPDACLSFLLDLVRRRRFEMIIPLGDIVTDLVCSRQQEFSKCARMLLVPYETFRIGRDKVNTARAARGCGVPIPRTWFPEEQDLDEIAGETDYPVLIKPAVANGARGITFVHRRDELREKYEAISRTFGRTFVQELVPHAGGIQHKVDLILERDGTLLAGVVYSKIRYYPPSGGSSVLNCSVHHPEILEYATRVARHIGWFGLCDFDFITDPRDGVPKLMEINPRFPESFRMCEAAGVDFPMILYRMACGERIEPQRDYAAGRYLRFLPGDLMWFMTAKGQRFKTRPSFFRFFDGDTTYQVLSLRDPGPIMAYLLENLMVLLDPKERGFRFRLKAAAGDVGEGDRP
jgi:predicted ATP-grasp superfamily ATP-dependent carboligase